MRLGDYGFLLRRFEKVLPARWRDGMEADKDRHRTASVGVADVQKPHQQHATLPSTRCQLHTMLPEPGPHVNGRLADQSGVQSVPCWPALFSRYVRYEDDPFVLEQHTKRIKKCRGCGKEFVDEKYVIRHEEKVYFVKNSIRRVTIAKVSYHCRPRCILRRNSDYNPNKLIVEWTI